MSNILSFIRRDARHLLSNVISLVVIVGIIVVPTFYAWFNIAAMWDPYGNTKNLKVAVANSDTGYKSDLMPLEVNVGERVVSDLRGSDSINYVVTDEDDALEGVRSGAYYAALVIPESFSSDMMTILSANPTHPQVIFYQNEKANAIAGIVTDKASTTVQRDIDESFASSVTSVGAGVLDQLGTYLDGDEMTQVASRLDTAVSDAQETISGTSRSVRSFSALLESTQGLLNSGTGTFDTSLSSTLDVGGSIRDTASGVRTLGDALDGATSSINDTLNQSSSSLGSVSDAIDNAFAVAGGQTDKLANALTKVNDDYVKVVVAQLQTLSDQLAGTDTLYDEYEHSVTEGNVSTQTIHQTRLTIQGLNDRVQQALKEMRELSGQLDKTVSDLEKGKTDAESARSELQRLVDQAKGSLSDAQVNYDANVRGSLQDLAGKIESAADEAEGIASSLSATLDSVNSTAGSAAQGLGDAKTSLDDTAARLDDAAADLGELHSQLRAALDSQDLDKLRAILSSDPGALASFISNPVSVDRNPVYPIENNGSAMAPFFTTLSIWIGGVILCALIKANPSEEAMAETGCGHTKGYIGRIFLFVMVGFLQALLICAGDLFFLGVQCAHPVLFFLAGLAASLAFVNIIYSLTASFGDVGKAIAVVLMVMQVAGSGGTCPREMLPAGFFQTVYPFLPFVHAENAFRAAMFGLYGNDFWREIGLLLLYLVPALLLGLVLRRPVIRLNEWVEHKIESTKVM